MIHQLYRNSVIQSLARISVEIWFHSNWAKTPGKKLSIAHPAYFVERKVATLHFTKFLRIAALGRPSERCLWIPWGKLYILYTFHFTKMGLDAQLTTFVSVNFIAFHQFSTEIRARLCNWFFFWKFPSWNFFPTCRDKNKTKINIYKIMINYFLSKEIRL